MIRDTAHYLIKISGIAADWKQLLIEHGWWIKMKMIVLFFLLLIVPRGQSASVVYICDSRHAKRYHLRDDCAGLHNCTHHIIKISLDDAKKSGKTLCSLESKVK